ncbi:hypothetical protein EYF80_062405 [Liparis tanakae]|uniref:Uncharacterized protein n=1 Tax=Liparis tanakae TaxID=230148 RepID=A0A4Z2EFY7_9TELE|nr:hypothetical protein EYF80_062405 [Liparis tanakae]
MNGNDSDESQSSVPRLRRTKSIQCYFWKLKEFCQREDVTVKQRVNARAKVAGASQDGGRHRRGKGPETRPASLGLKWRVGERTQQDSNPATSVWIYANRRTYKHEDYAGTLTTGPSTYRTRVK